MEVLLNILTSIGLLAILGGGIAWGRLTNRVERVEEDTDELRKIVEAKPSRAEFEYAQKEVNAVTAELRSIQDVLRSITSNHRTTK